MLGMKFRSWMEAHWGRPRKNKQRHKDTGGKNNKHQQRTQLTATTTTIMEHSPVDFIGNSPETTTNITTDVVKNEENIPRSYSNNLSSPESAYSTGYSTDGHSPHGNSPGASFPPEYYINLRTGTHYFHSQTTSTSSSFLFSDKYKTNKHTPHLPTCEEHYENYSPEHVAVRRTHRRTESADESRKQHPTIRTSFAQLDDLQSANSPRQRSRIRTNPWYSGSSCSSSGMSSQVNRNSNGSDLTTTSFGQSSDSGSGSIGKTIVSVKIPMKMMGSSRRGGKVTSPESSISDDCTLNEMGKYDESYVYEKETDILSDSDPTDCDEDIRDTDNGDTGRGESDGDTDDAEITFIDDGTSLRSFDLPRYAQTNTGHCYYVPDSRRSSGKRHQMSRKSSEENKFRRKRSANKAKEVEVPKHSTTEEKLIAADQEADLKYKELIQEAEVILANIKIGCQTPEEPSKPVIPPATKSVQQPAPTVQKPIKPSQKSSKPIPPPKPTPVPSRSRRHHQWFENSESSTTDNEEHNIHSTPTRNRNNKNNLSNRRSNPMRLLKEVSTNQKNIMMSPKFNREEIANDRYPHNLVNSPQANKRLSKPLSNIRRHGNDSTPKSHRKLLQHNRVGDINSPRAPRRIITDIDEESVIDTNKMPQLQLMTFRNVDTETFESNDYCPQSEPVKRKVYTCDTLNKIKKSLENQPLFHTSVSCQTHLSSVANPKPAKKSISHRSLSEVRESLEDKVKKLREERLLVEAKIREAQEEERIRKEMEQQQMNVIRRKMILQTLETLKKSLQAQSATLQENYLGNPGKEKRVGNKRKSISN